MAKRLHQTLADYVVIAISPALIMALVGSLVFFLLKVFYQGQYFGRLHWVMACFVFAAVLIGRISIEEGFERAVLFGIALAIPVGLATSRFIEVQGTWVDNFSWLINWGLIGLIWWCAHRLTWDCTVIDDDEDASGEGLLQLAGFDKPAAVQEAPPESPGPDDKATRRGKKHAAPPPLTARAAARLEGTTSREVPAGWWQRYVEKSRRPHAPGVWVVYFSLAALPLFGVGQWFIPVDDVAGRRYAFWLLAVYVAAGLGLLLTTSFLGLRRYLRQRRIEMPTLMANLWLSTGAVVIALLLVLAALLPRPNAEYAVSELPFTVGSPETSSSSHAPLRQEGTKDDENPSATPQSDATGQQDAKGSGGSEKTNAPPSGSGGDQKGKQGDEKGPAKSNSPASKSQPQSSDDKQKASTAAKSGENKQSSSAEQRGEQSAKQDPAAHDSAQDRASTPQRSEGSERAKAESDSAKQSRPGESNSAPQPASDQSPPQDSQDAQQGQQPPQPQQPNNTQPSAEQSKPLPGETQLPAPPTEELEAAGALVAWLQDYPKYLFYALVVCAVGYFLWRSRAEVLAALVEILSAFASLFGGLWGSKRRVPAAADDPRVVLELPPTPFSSYADPFASGAAAGATNEELVRYSFEAFEAWSREHGCPRNLDQTPHELARDVIKQNPQIAAEARSIAELYSRAAFARGELPADSREHLRQLWRRMSATALRTVEQF